MGPHWEQSRSCEGASLEKGEKWWINDGRKGNGKLVLVEVVISQVREQINERSAMPTVTVSFSGIEAVTVPRDGHRLAPERLLQFGVGARQEARVSPFRVDPHGEHETRLTRMRARPLSPHARSSS